MAAIEIVIPYYKGGDYIAETLTSVCQQSDEDWLCTIIDDASPDDHTVHNLVADIQDPRIRYLRHETNLGISSTFQHGLSCARTKWVTLLGQDDRLLPNYVDVINRATTHENLDTTMIQPGVRVIGPDGQPASPLADKVKSLLRLRPGVHYGEWLAISLLLGDWLYFPSIAWKVSAATKHGFAADLGMTMDLDHILSQIAEGNRLLVVDDLCFEYRRHSASESSQAVHDYRFCEERDLHSMWAQKYGQRGWRLAALASRCRPSSRLHRLQHDLVSFIPRGLLNGQASATTSHDVRQRELVVRSHHPAGGSTKQSNARMALKGVVRRESH